MVLLANLGTAFMRTGDTVNGEMYLRRALDAPATDNDIRPVLMVNLAACMRQAGKAVEAQAMISEARTAHSGTRDPELLLELELVAARICAESGDAGAVATALAIRMDAHIQFIVPNRYQAISQPYAHRLCLVKQAHAHSQSSIETGCILD